MFLFYIIILNEMQWLTKASAAFLHFGEEEVIDIAANDCMCQSFYDYPEITTASDNGH